jgi:hypothetical protein
VRWPWISREHHDDVIRAKDAQIRWQQETIFALEARISAPVAVTVKLPEDFAVLAPAAVELRRRRPVDTSTPGKEQSAEPDWANLDINDNVALAKAAAYELGGPASPYVLAQTIRQIKAQATRAKAEKLRRTLEEANVGTIATAEAGTANAQPDYVPENIRKRIEQASEGVIQ